MKSIEAKLFKNKELDQILMKEKKDILNFQKGKKFTLKNYL